MSVLFADPAALQALAMVVSAALNSAAAITAALLMRKRGQGPN